MISNPEIKRILFELLEQQDKKLTQVELLMLQNYKQALDDINILLADIYAQHSEKILKREFKAAQLTNLKNQIEERIVQLYFKDSTVINSTLREFYESNYSTIQNMLSVDLPFGRFSESQIVQAVSYDYNKIKWSDNEQKNIKKLIGEVKNQVAQGLIFGKSYISTSAKLADRLGVGAGRALRIVRTESHRIQNTSKIDALDKARKAAEAGGFVLLTKWIHGRGVKQPRDGKRDPDINHVIMNGVYSDIETGLFTLTDKTQTLSPGNTGIAKHDINCTCDMIFELR